jgi:putative copper resistance protein D
MLQLAMVMAQNPAEDTRTSERMFPALVSWDIASLISKLLWYLAVICVAGGSFSLWLIGDNTRRFLVRNLYYVLSGSIIGFHGVLVYFLIQVGIANDSGLAGMVDWPMVSFFLGTSIGEASLFRMAILLALIVAQLVALTYLNRRQKPPTQSFFRLLYRFNAGCLLALCLSLQVTGHVAPLSLIPRLALVLHVLAVSLWIGTLYPLRRVTLDFDSEQTQDIMHRFGNWAFAIVGVLLISAVIMAIQLISSTSEIIQSPYGLSLLAKVSFVCGLLTLAALNRWRLVPNLHKAGYMVRLRTSITTEMALAMVILTITVYLSTIVGPGHS